jgi:hypothetical protein
VVLRCLNHFKGRMNNHVIYGLCVFVLKVTGKTNFHILIFSGQWPLFLTYLYYTSLSHLFSCKGLSSVRDRVVLRFLNHFKGLINDHVIYGLCVFVLRSYGYLYV